MNKEEKAYIKGIEDGIEWVRQDMGGSALRMFDLHAWKIRELLKIAKEDKK